MEPLYTTWVVHSGHEAREGRYLDVTRFRLAILQTGTGLSDRADVAAFGSLKLALPIARFFPESAFPTDRVASKFRVAGVKE